MDLSVIIPVYRGGDILKDLFKKISNTLAENYNYEVIFVCDGCDTRSQSVLKKLKENHSEQLKFFHFARNYGQHRALQFGFSKAIGDFIVTIDEDLQHDPSDIIKLIEKQKEGDYDLVYGKFTNLKHKAIRNLFSAVLRRVLKHFVPALYENYSPYRLIKRETALQISTMVCPYTFIDDFLSKVTQNISNVDIIHHKRINGRSSYTLRKLIKHGIFIILAYSRIVSWLLALAAVIIFVDLLVIILTIFSSDNINSDIINNRTIAITLVVGLLLIIISFFGTFINQRNIISNTRPVQLVNEDSI